MQHQTTIQPQHARQGFSFETYQRHQPLFPCRKCIQPIFASYHILLRFLKPQPSNSNKVLRRLTPRKLAWEINSASKENSISQILLIDHRPRLYEERLCKHLDFESTRQKSSLRQDLLYLLIGILMILQDLCLKGRGEVHFVALNYQN